MFNTLGYLTEDTKKIAQATKKNSQSQGLGRFCWQFFRTWWPAGRPWQVVGPILNDPQHSKQWGFLSVSGAQKNSLLIKDIQRWWAGKSPIVHVVRWVHRIFYQDRNGTSYLAMESDLISLIHRWLKSPTCTGWWYTYPSEKYEFVSWDDDIPNWMEIHKIHVPVTTNQLN